MGIGTNGWDLEFDFLLSWPREKKPNVPTAGVESVCPLHLLLLWVWDKTLFHIPASLRTSSGTQGPGPVVKDEDKQNKSRRAL